MDPSKLPKTILLNGDAVTYNIKASEDLTPGYIVNLNSDGELAAGTDITIPRFVREQEWTGHGIDTDIPSGDTAPVLVVQKGGRVYAWLQAGESVNTGDILSASASNGALAATGTVAIAQALEDVDNGGGAEPVRIKVEVA